MLRSVVPALLLLATVVVSPAGTAGQQEQLHFVEREAERKATGVLTEGETRTFSFSAREPNLTRVDFILTWTETGDAAGLSAPDSMSLSVSGPEGRADGRGPVASGRVHVRIPVAAVPPPQTVPAKESGARMAELASHDGRGDWIARVRLADVGNPAALAPVDSGNSFELLVVLTTYEAVPALVVRQVGQADNDGGLGWGAASAALAALVVGATVALAWPIVTRLLPRRGNTPSATAEQRGPLP